MPIPITLADLLSLPEPPWSTSSGITIPHTLRGEPERAAGCGGAFAGRDVAVFCVHGHEVTHDVADRMTESGVDAVCVEGGFAARETAGNPLVAIGDEP